MSDEPAPRPLTAEEYKLLLQLETSLLVWLRTSLALMGFGFVIARFGLFLREVAAAQVGVPHHPWLGAANTAVGTGLILLGVAVMLVATLTHQRRVAQLERGDLRRPSRWSLCVALCAVGMSLAGYLALV